MFCLYLGVVKDRLSKTFCTLNNCGGIIGKNFNFGTDFPFYGISSNPPPHKALFFLKMKSALSKIYSCIAIGRHNLVASALSYQYAKF